MTNNNFTWDNDNKFFKSNSPQNTYIPNRSVIRTIMVRPTNGSAVLGVYITSDIYIEVFGVISKTMSNDISAFQFDLYIGYV